MKEKFGYIINAKEKRGCLWLLLLMVLGSLLELLAVAVFNPFVQLLMDPGTIERNQLLHTVYYGLGLRSLNRFLGMIAVGIIILYVVKGFYMIWVQHRLLKYSYGIQERITGRLITTYMSEPYTFHLNKNVSEIQRCLQNDSKQFMQVILYSLQLVTEVIISLVLAIYLFTLSKTISVMVLLLLGICLGFFLVVSKKISGKIGARNLKYSTKIFQWINQSFGGIKEVKVLHRERFFVDTYRSYFQKFTKGARQNQLLGLLPKYVIEAVCISGMLVAVIIKMMFGQGDLVEFVPQISTFAVAAFKMLPSVGKINSYVNSIIYALPSVGVIYDDLREIENHSAQLKEEKADESLWHFEDAIEIRDVVYRYPETDKVVIDHVSFPIKKGNVTAFIGASGAGKTTMADIMLGLLVPEEGGVFVDGRNIADNMALWHKHLGYISQVIYLSDDTIRNNIAFGMYADEIDDKKIWEALTKAQLADFVRGLPEQLNTMVGDRGVRISGGQRQRIGIARALYHDPDILILDEATSALDNETERAVMESIDSLRGEKTLVIIAHRLTTIRNADAVYEFEAGHARLKDKEEIFAAL